MVLPYFRTGADRKSGRTCRFQSRRKILFRYVPCRFDDEAPPAGPQRLMEFSEQPVHIGHLVDQAEGEDEVDRAVQIAYAQRIGRADPRLDDI